MNKQLVALTLMGFALSGCAAQQAMDALRCNTQAIEWSTCAIVENAEAIEAANAGIEENRRQIEEVNKRLQEMNKS